jgi:hypothetical protein
MYKSIAVGLASALIGFSPAYAAHCNCNAKYHAKYHALKYTKHYYTRHQTVGVPFYRVPCSERDGDWDYSAERSLYCLVISPKPGESQSQYDFRTFTATRDYVFLERKDWLKREQEACREARNEARDTAEAMDPATNASCRSAGF